MIALKKNLNIAGYCRISVDDETNPDNASIENQKLLLQQYVKANFPNSTLTFYIDRDRSGYTFEQREGYQEMRPLLLNHHYEILLVKDFSRFARRNSRGLVELEDLRDAGVRIISVGDGIDYPTYDDWTAIQFRFLINEMPVTDASKKVKSVIKQRQNIGKWICSVPYGYTLQTHKNNPIEVDIVAGEVVKEIFRLYQNGYGYKKIANHLTNLNIPTPRTLEKQRKESLGIPHHIKSKKEWSIITIQGILNNDFYIGTLRQRKYTRKKINGEAIKIDEDEHIIFENNHESIIDSQTFQSVQADLKKRSTTHYRGIRKYENPYSGVLYCGDCFSPMFSRSNPKLKPAYICGNYHARGLASCTSHHIRCDLLDTILKEYIFLIKENSSNLLQELNELLQNEPSHSQQTKQTAEHLQEDLSLTYEELKATKRQRIKDILKSPDKEELLEETYNELESELQEKIIGLKNQISLINDKQSSVIKLRQISKSAEEIFDGILKKESLSKADLNVLVEKILVYNNHIEIQLKSDIDEILRFKSLSEGAINFNEDTANRQFTHQSKNHLRKIYGVRIIYEGDPLEIFTDREGEIILKKYSPIGELGTFAKEYAESLAQTIGHITCIVDKDQIIAVSGGSKREFYEKHISQEMEKCIHQRTTLIAQKNDHNFVPVLADDTIESYNHQLITPIIAEGDAMGAVIFLSKDKSMGEIEGKLAQSAAGFLGKQMES